MARYISPPQTQLVGEVVSPIARRYSNRCLYTTPGTYSFTVPGGVTEILAVAVGPGTSPEIFCYDCKTRALGTGFICTNSMSQCCKALNLCITNYTCMVVCNCCCTGSTLCNCPAVCAFTCSQCGGPSLYRITKIASSSGGGYAEKVMPVTPGSTVAVQVGSCQGNSCVCVSASHCIVATGACIQFASCHRNGVVNLTSTTCCTYADGTTAYNCSCGVCLFLGEGQDPCCIAPGQGFGGTINRTGGVGTIDCFCSRFICSWSGQITLPDTSYTTWTCCQIWAGCAPCSSCFVQCGNGSGMCYLCSDGGSGTCQRVCFATQCGMGWCSCCSTNNLQRYTDSNNQSSRTICICSIFCTCPNVSSCNWCNSWTFIPWCDQNLCHLTTCSNYIYFGGSSAGNYYGNGVQSCSDQAYSRCTPSSLWLCNNFQCTRCLLVCTPPANCPSGCINFEVVAPLVWPTGPSGMCTSCVGFSGAKADLIDTFWLGRPITTPACDFTESNRVSALCCNCANYNLKNASGANVSFCDKLTYSFWGTTCAGCNLCCNCLSFSGIRGWEAGQASYATFVHCTQASCLWCTNYNPCDRSGTGGIGLGAARYCGGQVSDGCVVGGISNSYWDLFFCDCNGVACWRPGMRDTFERTMGYPAQAFFPMMEWFWGNSACTSVCINFDYPCCQPGPLPPGSCNTGFNHCKYWMHYYQNLCFSTYLYNCNPSYGYSCCIVKYLINTGTSAPAQFIGSVSGILAQGAVQGGAGSAAPGSWPQSAGGFISSATLTNGGSGYTSTPTVIITGGGGVDADIAPIMSFCCCVTNLTSGGGTTTINTICGGSVVGVKINNRGKNFTSAPCISFVGGGAGTPACASLNLSFDTTSFGSGGGSCCSPQTIIQNIVVVDSDAVKCVIPAYGGRGNTVRQEPYFFSYPGISAILSSPASPNCYIGDTTTGCDWFDTTQIRGGGGNGCFISAGYPTIYPQPPGPGGGGAAGLTEQSNYCASHGGILAGGAGLCGNGGFGGGAGLGGQPGGGMVVIYW